ncbi:MAG TPA: hypothetical protein VJN18_35155 [Polyangiaceae bacterium]|nr:hypothetical protein [Polyangiaceae bacterium]
MMKTDSGRAIAGFSARRKKKTVGIVAKIGAIAGALALVSSPAAADDTTFPGSMCLPNNDQWTYDLRRLTPYLYSGANTPVFVTCPVPRERPAAQTTIYSYVRIHEPVTNPGGQPMECTFFSALQSGLVVDSETREAAGVGSGDQYLEFYNISSYSWGAFGISCDLPPGGKIYNYYLSE